MTVGISRHRSRRSNQSILSTEVVYSSGHSVPRSSILGNIFTARIELWIGILLGEPIHSN